MDEFCSICPGKGSHRIAFSCFKANHWISIQRTSHNWVFDKPRNMSLGASFPVGNVGFTQTLTIISLEIIHSDVAFPLGKLNLWIQTLSEQALNPPNYSLTTQGTLYPSFDKQMPSGDPMSHDPHRLPQLPSGNSRGKMKFPK